MVSRKRIEELEARLKEAEERVHDYDQISDLYQEDLEARLKLAEDLAEVVERLAPCSCEREGAYTTFECPPCKAITRWREGGKP